VQLRPVNVPTAPGERQIVPFLEDCAMAMRITLGLGSLLLGALAIFPLFGIGEGTGSGILAFAIIAVALGLVAFFLSRIDPKGGPIFALILCAPVAFLCFSSAGGDYVLAALAVILVAQLGARLGARRPARPQQQPPAAPPLS
jgi:hypothetical protein